jgi:carboxypeptidase Taq
MGVHESQSRSYENQLGRSRAFTGWLFGRMREVFGEFGIADAEGFYQAVNRVHPGYIRTEADEVHYNLHVMMRFDLERALIKGDLQVEDLEAAWNDRFRADFGVAVDRPSNGMLQDVHWSCGLFGYFPTYTLGNVYAGCLVKALRAEVAGAGRADGRGRRVGGDRVAAGAAAAAWGALRAQAMSCGGPAGSSRRKGLCWTIWRPSSGRSTGSEPVSGPAAVGRHWRIGGRGGKI